LRGIKCLEWCAAEQAVVDDRFAFQEQTIF